ncbi:group III truncated hemoglobin [Diaphorobacter sp. HDW4A]|uniref:group III truncated hemoglobin n=1 Tax=Diaphorobacter sp. HDW4A TaxID=2714924 RepID=UPI0019806D50|nr:group III truncated hemoglobin [Diaphorobacter sp. HDW4A]
MQDFYSDVMQHPLLGPVFAKELGVRRDAHLDRMVDFWSTVMLGSRSFRGNLVQRHRQLTDVNPAHFNAWIQLWAQHTSGRFDSSTTNKLRRVAHDIGRQLFVSYFDGSSVRRAHADEKVHEHVHAQPSPRAH